MAQSEVGEIKLFNDFTGGEVGIANAVAYSASTGFFHLGDFKVIGDGIDVVDSCAVAVDGGLGGVIRLTTTNEDAHTAALATEVMFVVQASGGVDKSGSGPLLPLVSLLEVLLGTPYPPVASLPSGDKSKSLG